MKIYGIIWLRDIADKLEFKHNVTMEEVEETLKNKPKFRFIEKGERKGRWMRGLSLTQDNIESNEVEKNTLFKP
jgi:hypothetical protein